MGRTLVGHPSLYKVESDLLRIITMEKKKKNVELTHSPFHQMKSFVLIFGVIKFNFLNMLCLLYSFK